MTNSPRYIGITLLLLSLIAIGCSTSTNSPDNNSSTNTNATDPIPDNPTVKNTNTEDSDAIEADGKWVGYEDVPYVPIMTELDGIEIPRIQKEKENITIIGELPSDEFNTYATSQTMPVTGGQITIRASNEPKTMNAIVETSAIQSYLSEWIQLGLASQNPETLEYEPSIASEWVKEDSVKLSSNLANYERKISIGSDTPTDGLAITFEDSEQTESFQTYDKNGESLGNTWIGFYASGDDMLGAPIAGYHYWSDADGKLEVSGLVPGSYNVKVGAELAGATKLNEDGSLTVTPTAKGNPLEEPVTLLPGEWTDIQRETIFTYRLNENATWSDGTPFTTKDLEFGFAAINNPYVDGESIRTYYADVIECKAIDKSTIRLRYRTQYFLAFEFTVGLAAYTPPFHIFEKYLSENGKQLTLENLTPEQEESQNKISAHGQAFGKFFNTDDRYNQSPIGTGPYLIDKWIVSDRIEFVRNPNYWNAAVDPAFIDRIIVKFIPDATTAMAAFKAGEVDFLWRMTNDQFFLELNPEPDWFKENKHVKAMWYSPSYSYFGWNMLNDKLKDRRVRIALRMLFDVDEFIAEKLHGAAVSVTGSQYYFGPGYDHSVAPIAHDPALAKELLAEAGWFDSNGDGVLDKNGEPLELEILFPPGNPTVEVQVAMVQENFKRAGITLQTTQLEWASFIDKVKAKEPDIVRLGWAQSLESDPFQIWHSSGASKESRGSNHVSFANHQADALIDQLRITLDPEKRKRIHWSFHRILDREQPYMFLYAAQEVAVYNSKFRGVKWYRLRPGFDLTEWYIPKELQ